MKPNHKKIGALFAFGMLFTGLAVSAIQFHNPLEITADIGCTLLTGWLAPSYCNPDPSNIEFNADNTDTLKNSIYGNGLTTEDNRQQIVQNQEAHLNQSYGIGMSYAKFEAINQLNNGSSVSKAQNNAFSKLNNFYSTIERQNLVYRNREMLSLKQSIDRAMEDGQINVWTDGTTCNGGSSARNGLFEVSGFPQDSSDGVADFRNARLINQSVTLINGTNYTAYGLQIEAYQLEQYDCQNTNLVYRNKTVVSPDPQGTAGMGNGQILVKDADYNNSIPYFNSSQWNDVTTQLDDQYSKANNNVGTLTQDIFNQYEQGELNLSSIEYGPLETLKVASTSYEDTGLYNYRSISLQQMGLASNDSYAFNVTFDGKGPVIGQVFVKEDQFNQLETNKTYDVNGRYVSIIYQDGDKAERERIENNFTINSMRNPETGETVNVTSVQSNQWYSGNTFDLQKQIEELKEDEREIELDFNLGFGGLFEGSNSTEYAVILAIAVVLLVAVL